MKKMYFTLFALVALIGCNKEQISTSSPIGKEVFTVEAAPYENAFNDSATKSKYFDEDGQKITNLNVWVYSPSGSLANTGTIPGTSVSYKTYFENQTQLDGDLLFPDFDETYDIYIFTNVGQITPPASKAAADVFKYPFSSYDSFSSNGFPMAAHYKFRPSDPSVSHSLLATRLVSKYTVTFNFKGDNNYDFVLKSATVKRSANVITPFIADSKASSISDVFESADELDATKLTVPAGQDLYMLENVQGTVFNSGVERSEKNIAYEAKPVTTYLEFVGELDKNDGTGYNKVTCRYYFGSGTYAGVKRNFNIPLTLTMSNSILNHDDWIVTPEAPYNTGYVEFSPSSLSIVGDENWNAFYAQPYSAEGINDNVKFTLSYNSSDFSTAGLTLQYRKSASDAWANYSGQELMGKYYFQVKSTYSGSTPKTIKIETSTGQNTNIDLVITVKSEEIKWYLELIEADYSACGQDGGRAFLDYKLYGKRGEEYIGTDLYRYEVIDCGYSYDSNNNRIPASCDVDLDLEVEDSGDSIKITNAFEYGGNYQDYRYTENCLVRIDYDNTESYYAEYVFSFNPEPGPGPDEPITPVTPKHGLYYQFGYTVQQIDACGTFSSKYNVDTSTYFGECIYREFKASEDYSENGSSYPIIQTNKRAKFIYYDNDGHENYISPIEGTKTILVNNMMRIHKTGRQYPYADGWFWCGSHVSSITLTVQLPDGQTKTIWGLIEEEDEFGGLWSYGY